MKKKAAAIILSLILASGSTGIAQVQAADTTGQEAAAEAMEAGNAAASGSCGEHVKWTLTGAGNNLTLTSIGQDAFEKCETLESIKIPENVTEIGCRAFSECSSLTSVNIPYGVTCIEEGVFDVCWNLTGINIPESDTCIRDDAFAGSNI